MGKKDKKDSKEKKEARAAKQATKQAKAVKKHVGKELAEQGEEDIESILAEIRLRDSARSAVSVNVVAQPSRRSNFSMTSLPNGDMLMFGGEFCDGQGTVVYNELFQWNVSRNEWRQIESLNTPPPRCSHQAVYFKDRVFVFGGEYATLDQFHHYRDLWALDLRTSTWTELHPRGDCPSPRSGHRMVVWRNSIVLFGGFYEAMREVHWYNDLYFYSFAEEMWTKVVYKPLAHVPRARSGHQMVVHASDDSLFVCGGFSKEKQAGIKNEGYVHTDVWVLNLVAALGARGSALDVQKCTWQKVSKKGHMPSPRCGAVMTLYKNKGLLFGGVHDDEGPRHSLTSRFFADLFAFDMERRRWYQLGLKTAKEGGKRRKKKEAGGAAASGSGDGKEGEDDEDDDDDDEEEEEEDEGEEGGEGTSGADGRERDAAGPQSSKFGYIDESGNIVYIDMEECDEGGERDAEGGVGGVGGGEGVFGFASLDEAATAAVAVDRCTRLEEEDEEKEGGAHVAGEEKVDDYVPRKKRSEEDDDDDDDDDEDEEEEKRGKGRKGKADEDEDEDEEDEGEGEEDGAAAGEARRLTTSRLGAFFGSRTEPCARINPCLMLRGNTLLIYGGVTEIGDIEVTLDDCWSLDLNKRDSWRRVLPGSMHELVWRGEADESTDGTLSEGEELDDDDDDAEAEDERGAKKAGGGSRGGGSGAGARSGRGGVREETQKLRAQVGAEDEQRTPHYQETLREFYVRTTPHWTQAAIDKWREAQAVGGDSAPLSEKELKTQGFKLAEARYSQILPFLGRVWELEAQQREDEGGAARTERGSSSSSSSSSSSRNREKTGGSRGR